VSLVTGCVLHVTDSPAFGGAEQAILTLMAGLDRSRWTSALAHHPSEAVAPLVEGAHALGVQTWSIPRMDPGLQGITRLPAFVAGLRRRRPTIVHAHLTWPLASQYALIGARVARVPAVVATLQLHVDLTLSTRVHVQQRFLTRAVDRYIAVSAHVRDRVVESLDWPAEKIEVIHNSVEPVTGHVARADVRKELVGDSAVPVVLVPARLEEQKGHVHLLDAACLVPDVTFVFAGAGSQRHALEERVRALGLVDRVRFLGERRDIPDLLAACDLVVLPSLSEGLPLALLEAMAAGVPVVASQIGGVDELITSGETGLLVEVGDVEGLAAAIRHLLGDRPLALALASAAKADVLARFSAHDMCRRVEDVYASVTAR
jgi:glycosyltransferase involved in cell wall biosynthesis